MGRDLFEKEQNDLLADLKDIPKKACDRRVCPPFSFPVCSSLAICLSKNLGLNSYTFNLADK